MNVRPFALFMLLLAGGCATPHRPDEITQVVSALERMEADAVAKDHYEQFPYRHGISVGIVLPSNAPPPEVARQALMEDDWPAYYASSNFAVVSIRTVLIRPPQMLDRVVDPNDLPLLLAERAHENLTAMLVQTAMGKRVVLVHFCSMPVAYPGGFWEHRTYDPNQLRIERIGASRSDQSKFDAERRLAPAAHAQCWAA